MTQQEINNGNKLIAEFMGVNPARIVDELPVNEHKEYTTENNKWVLINSLQYNYSWDALMSVVEKIEHDYMYEVRPVWEHCVIQDAGENNEELYIETDGSSKLEATYKAVIEFIKWYNEKKEDDVPVMGSFDENGDTI